MLNGWGSEQRRRPREPQRDAMMGKTLPKLAIILALCSSALPAQEAGRPPVKPPPFVTATGESTIEAKPDQATINIGVVTQASTASAASSQNATQLTAVLDKIKSEIGGKGEIRTAGYSVNPNLSYPNPPNSGGPKIVGYTASNTVRVKLDDISLVGRVVDAATATGANAVHGIQFSVKDEQGVRAQALQEAARKARSAGEAIASALGLRVVRVQSAEAGHSSFVRPMMAMQMSSAARAQTPVEPGSVEISATVTVTLEVVGN